MTQNRRSEQEAQYSSSGEEEVEGSSEENEEEIGSESESEEAQKISPPKTSVIKKPSTPKKPETSPTTAQPQPSSDESDSESDSPPEKSLGPDPNIKPIASKPMEGPPKFSKKPRSKPTLHSATPAKSSAAVKRPVESENNQDTKDSRKAKRKASDAEVGISEANGAKKTSGDDSKKQLFQRLWSEDDEIVILKGMIEYATKKEADPVADMNAFHDFIKKSLHVDVSKVQLSDKVRRLKKKYENNSSKGKNGNDRTFSKPHEQKAYELSKKIWGSEAIGGGADNTKLHGTSRKNHNQRATKAEASSEVDGISSPDKLKEVPKTEIEHNVTPAHQFRVFRSIVLGNSSLEREIIEDGLELIAGPKRSEMEEKWTKLRVKEVELYLKRVELIREQTELVLEALRSSRH